MSLYAAIDLKSFYASAECVKRGLDPLTTNLVVADISRTEKTICLAVSPSLKVHGIPGRARLFEVVQKVGEVNFFRQQKAPGRKFSGSSADAVELAKDPSLAVDYIVATPQMAHYIECSTRIYQVYLKYVAPEDIHVYSIDEVFMDITPYLSVCGLTAHAFVSRIVRDVFETTGITAAAGIGSNLYLAKVAMDIMAKRVEPNEYGVRIAELDEMGYRQQLWNHRPLTDFWRVGGGYARRLEKYGMHTMGDVARCSIIDERLLYDQFGVNAELLIDHAWGWEPCTIADIKAYKPSSSSLGSGQVLHRPYPFDQARLIVKEMADQLALDLLQKKLFTDQLVLSVGYDIESLKDPYISRGYTGEITTDHFGRKVPKHAHGSVSLKQYTSSEKMIVTATAELFDRIVDPELLVRRVMLTAGRVIPESDCMLIDSGEQLSLLIDYEAEEKRRAEETAELERERRRQLAVLDLRRRFGKNAVFRGMDLKEGATTRDRNEQIGGHKA